MRSKPSVIMLLLSLLALVSIGLSLPTSPEMTSQEVDHFMGCGGQTAECQPEGETWNAHVWYVYNPTTPRMNTVVVSRFYANSCCPST